MIAVLFAGFLAALAPSAAAAMPAAAAVSRTFKIEHRYLNLPIKNGAPKRRVNILIDGARTVASDIELADAQPDWWAFVDLKSWRGQTLVLQVDELPRNSAALGLIELSDSIKGAGNLYREALRPQFHFSPQRGWMNDPNGLVYYRGEYQLFFQHYPFGWKRGEMYWGHATSRDLVHWREHGEALAPDNLGQMFSGSAVVDGKNTSGFAKAGGAPLVLIYTAWGDSTVQCLAYSEDGRHFSKFAGNPVVGQIAKGNRDPKVFWHAPTRKWVMVLYVPTLVAGGGVDERGKPLAKHTIHFLTSPDLRSWRAASVTPGGTGGDRYLYECPDFYELPIDGNPANRRWVLSAANGEYAVGRFDGEKFTPEASRLRGIFGGTFYAAQTYNDLPDGRRIQMAWGRVPSPGMPFNQLQLLPCEIRLEQTALGPRLTRRPIPELAKLRDGPNQGAALAGFHAELIELRADFDPGRHGVAEFDLRGARVIFDAAAQTVSVNGQTAPAPLTPGSQHLMVFVDRTVIEVFASDGLTYLALPFIPKADEQSVAVALRGPGTKMNSLQVYKLKSIWQQ